MNIHQRIVKVKLYIDGHYQDPIDLSAMADTACISRYHFIRIFKGIYGHTPHFYLTKVRIKNAGLLLAEGASVAEVSTAVGFESTTSFAGLFKKITGHTPSAFRQREARRKEQLRSNPLTGVPNCFAERHGWTKKSNFQEQ